MADEDEEEDWKDALPVTPICSPARRPARFRYPDRRSPTRYVDVDNDVEIIHEFYPTTSKTMHEETSIVSYGGTIIVETTRIPRHSKDVAGRMEKVAPRVKLKKQSSLEHDRAPSEAAREPTERARGRSPKRRGSLESEGGRTSTSRETLERSDTSSEKGARRKVFAEREDGRRRRSRRSGEKRPGSRTAERRTEEEEEEEQPSRRKPEDEEPARRKDHQEESYRRSREERKSLKEQECIERVTEFLTRHSGAPTYPDASASGLETTEYSVPEAVDVERKQTEQRVKRPAIISKEGESERPPATTVETSIASTRRRGSLKSVPERAEDFKDTGRPAESKKQRRMLERAPAAISDATQQPEATQAQVAPEVKRPSSLRKRRDSFSRESSRESLLEEKKGVRIQEDVQEIFFEDTSEQVTDLLPEVQLVTARIISAEEASAIRFEETAAAMRFEEAATRIEIHSPPEVAVVPETVVRARLMRAPSPEVVTSLQLPALAKSTSDSTLAEGKPDSGEDKRVSLRNLKPEILLDLSKVSDNGDEIEEGGVEEGGEPGGEWRLLSRTGSEGSKRLSRAQKQEEFPFRIGSLAQPDRPELTILHEGLAERRESAGSDITGKIATEAAKEDAAR